MREVEQRTDLGKPLHGIRRQILARSLLVVQRLLGEAGDHGVDPFVFPLKFVRSQVAGEFGVLDQQFDVAIVLVVVERDER